MIETIITAILSSFTITGILLWLMRSWISERLKNSIRYEYDQKLESHKSQIKYEAERELEHIKAQLQIDAERRSIQYSKIFQEIAETVAGVYEKVVIAKDAVGSYVSLIEWNGELSKEGKRKIAGDALQEFFDYFKVKKIYLPHETADKVDGFVSGLYDMTIDFMYGIEKGGDERRARKGEEVDTWQKAHEYMKKELPPILYALEEEFRGLLGVNQAINHAKQVQAEGPR